ncbi:hypothetical protein ACQ4WX_32540 [Streptomyces lasalocidi]
MRSVCPCGRCAELWTAAAREARKERWWIEQCIGQVACEAEPPPLAHQAFIEAMRAPYTAYARAFLLAEDRVRWAVGETFDLLWLSWDTVASSENVRRGAWLLLRSRVLARATHRDGRPDLRAAVFSTEEVSDSVPGHLVLMTDLVDLFDAIARLPQDQMDVVVLGHLCGLDLAETIPYVTGLSPAITHAVDHHARAALEALLHRAWLPGVNPTAMTDTADIDTLLARARLRRRPEVPADTVPYEDSAYPAYGEETMDPRAPGPPTRPRSATCAPCATPCSAPSPPARCTSSPTSCPSPSAPGCSAARCSSPASTRGRAFGGSTPAAPDTRPRRTASPCTTVRAARPTRRPSGTSRPDSTP